MTADGLTVYLLGGGVAGFIAAAVMVLPMGHQSDGWTPAFIAAAVLTGTHPEDVSFGRASVIHHGAGALVGTAYGGLVVGLSVFLPDSSWISVSVVSHVVAVMGVVVGVYLLFAHLMLPRVGGNVYEERATAVRGQWVRSTLIFAAGLTIAGPPAIVLVRGLLGGG